MAEFYQLGEEVIGISAEHGQNIGELLDAVLEKMRAWEIEGQVEEEEELKVGPTFEKNLNSLLSNNPKPPSFILILI